MRVLLFITGFLSSSVQFILLREMSCLSGSSENTTALFLALWLVLSSAGAMAAKKTDKFSTGRLFCLLLIAPCVSLLLFLVSGRLLLHPGEVMPLPRLLIMLLATQAPVAVVSAFTFVRLSVMRNDNLNSAPGNSFGIETIGSVLAGIMATLSALWFVASFQFYFIIVTISTLVAAITIQRPSPLKASLFYIPPAAAIIFLIITYPPDFFIRNFQLRNISTTETFDTPYGNITTGIYKNEHILLYNFHPLFYAYDETQSEEDTHYAMLQTEKHEKILLISGGLLNHIDEILKYNPQQVYYSEPDPGLLKVEKKESLLADYLNVVVAKEDAFRQIMRAEGDYDVILQLTDQPLTLSTNRYYSSEYFSHIRANLREGGVFACAPFASYNYVSKDYIVALSSIVNALRISFRNVSIIRGNKLYLLASDSTLRTDICALLQEKDFSNVYVNCNYLTDSEITNKSHELLSMVDKDIKPNSLVKPVASWYWNRLISEKYGSGRSFLIILIILVLIPLVRLKRATVPMYSSSAALAGLGIIVIFIFQATFGNAHLLSAIILSVLFLGLAAGAAWKIRDVKYPVIFPLSLAVILAATSLLSVLVSDFQTYPLLFILLPVLVFMGGVLTGSYYRSLTSERRSDITGKVYSADLAGAATGYLITGTILIPLTGIVIASLILSCIILISLALVSVMPKL